jgi:hypothetical protein
LQSNLFPRFPNPTFHRAKTQSGNSIAEAVINALENH